MPPPLSLSIYVHICLHWCFSKVMAASFHFCQSSSDLFHLCRCHLLQHRQCHRGAPPHRHLAGPGAHAGRMEVGGKGLAEAKRNPFFSHGSTVFVEIWREKGWHGSFWGMKSKIRGAPPKDTPLRLHLVRPFHWKMIQVQGWKLYHPRPQHVCTAHSILTISSKKISASTLIFKYH